MQLLGHNKDFYKVSMDRIVVYFMVPNILWEYITFLVHEPVYTQHKTHFLVDFLALALFFLAWSARTGETNEMTWENIRWQWNHL